MEDKRETATESAAAHQQARRRLIKTLAATGGAFATATLLPRQWTRPIIDSIIVPVHAQASGPVIGLFTTTALPGASIFDLIVQPVYAQTGNVTVGNVSFDVAWDAVADGYTLCGAGEAFTSNGLVNFSLSGTGGRTGNVLDDFSQNMADVTEGRVDGTLTLFNQIVDGSQLTFDASLEDDTSTGNVAVPGGECSINVTVGMKMSSPYRDEELA